MRSNVGAVAAGFLLKYVGNLQDSLFVLGWAVLACALCAISLRFSAQHKAVEQSLYDQAIAQRAASSAGTAAFA